MKQLIILPLKCVKLYVYNMIFDTHIGSSEHFVTYSRTHLLFWKPFLLGDRCSFFRFCFLDFSCKLKIGQIVINIKSNINVSMTESVNIGKSSQLEKRGFGSLHNLTWACYQNEGIQLRHWVRFTNEVDWTSLNSLLRFALYCRKAIPEALDDCR